jgi:hypothetical protein
MMMSNKKVTLEVTESEFDHLLFALDMDVDMSTDMLKEKQALLARLQQIEKDRKLAKAEPASRMAQ